MYRFKLPDGRYAWVEEEGVHEFLRYNPRAVQVFNYQLPDGRKAEVQAAGQKEFLKQFPDAKPYLKMGYKTYERIMKGRRDRGDMTQEEYSDALKPPDMPTKLKFLEEAGFRDAGRAGKNKIQGAIPPEIQNYGIFSGTAVGRYSEKQSNLNKIASDAYKEEAYKQYEKLFSIEEELDNLKKIGSENSDKYKSLLNQRNELNAELQPNNAAGNPIKMNVLKEAETTLRVRRVAKNMQEAQHVLNVSTDPVVRKAAKENLEHQQGLMGVLTTGYSGREDRAMQAGVNTAESLPAVFKWPLAFVSSVADIFGLGRIRDIWALAPHVMSLFSPDDTQAFHKWTGTQALDNALTALQMFNTGLFQQEKMDWSGWSWVDYAVTTTLASAPYMLATMINPIVGGGIMFTDMYGKNVSESVRKYGSYTAVPDYVMINNMLKTTLEMAIELTSDSAQIALIKGAGKALGGAGTRAAIKSIMSRGGESFWRFAGNMALGGLTEGVEEWLQGMSNYYLDRAFGEVEARPLAELLKEWGNAFAVGAFGGLLWGGIGGAVQSRADAKNFKMLQERAAKGDRYASDLMKSRKLILDGKFNEAMDIVAPYFDTLDDIARNKEMVNPLVFSPEIVNEMNRQRDALVRAGVEKHPYTDAVFAQYPNLKTLSDEARMGMTVEAALERPEVYLDTKKLQETAQQEMQDTRTAAEDKAADVLEDIDETSSTPAPAPTPTPDIVETKVEPEKAKPKDYKFQREIPQTLKEIETEIEVVRALMEMPNRKNASFENPDGTKGKEALSARLERLEARRDSLVEAEQSKAKPVSQMSLSELHNEYASYKGEELKSQRALDIQAELKSREAEMGKAKPGTANAEIERKDPVNTGSLVRRVLGKVVEVVTGKMTPMKVRYALVDREHLVASHTTIYTENKAYPQELQNRSRTSDRMKDSVEKIVGKPRPNLLLHNEVGAEGRPIIYVDKQGRPVVISGNGRVMALNLMAERQQTEKIAEYEKTVREHLSDFGIEDQDVSGKVLVAVYYGDGNVVDLAMELNESHQKKLTEAEQAMTDARVLQQSAEAGDDIFVLLRGDANELMDAKNEKFIDAFIEKCIDDKNDVMVGGQYTDSLQRRIENALFMYLFNQDAHAQQLLETFRQTGDSRIKWIMNGLIASMPEIAKLNAMVQKYGLANYDIMSDLLAALVHIDDLRRRGIDVFDAFQEQDIFNENQEYIPSGKQPLYKALYEIRSNKSAFMFIAGYYSNVSDIVDPEQVTLFSEGKKPSKQELFDNYLKEWNDEQTRKASAKAEAKESVEGAGREIRKESKPGEPSRAREIEEGAQAETREQARLTEAKLRNRRIAAEMGFDENLLNQMLDKLTPGRQRQVTAKLLQAHAMRQQGSAMEAQTKSQQVRKERLLNEAARLERDAANLYSEANRDAFREMLSNRKVQPTAARTDLPIARKTEAVNVIKGILTKAGILENYTENDDGAITMTTKDGTTLTMNVTENAMTVGGKPRAGFLAHEYKGDFLHAMMNIAEAYNQGNMTTYHEFFHFAWQALLSDKQRSALLDYYEHQSGIGRYSNFVNLEEYIADSFMGYAMMAEHKPSNVIKKVFNYLANAIYDIHRALLFTEYTDRASDVFKGLLEGEVTEAEKLKPVETAEAETAARETKFRDIDADMEIARMGGENERAALASKEGVSEDAQIILAQDDSYFVLFSLAENPHISPAAQIELVHNSYRYIDDILRGLVRNPALTGDAQIAIVNSGITVVMQRLADNKNITQAAQELLALHPRRNIALVLASNEAITEKTQMLLFERDDNEVRKYLAKNQGITETVQLKLLATWGGIRTSLATNRSITERVQLALADAEYLENYPPIGVMLESNPSLTEAAQLKLAGEVLNDDNEYAYYRLGSNPSLVVSLQEKIAEHDNIGLAINVLYGRGLALHVAEKLLARLRNKLSTKDYIESLRKIVSPAVQELIFKTGDEVEKRALATSHQLKTPAVRKLARPYVEIAFKEKMASDNFEVRDLNKYIDNGWANEIEDIKKHALPAVVNHRSKSKMLYDVLNNNYLDDVYLKDLKKYADPNKLKKLVRDIYESDADDILNNKKKITKEDIRAKLDGQTDGFFTIFPQLRQGVQSIAGWDYVVSMFADVPAIEMSDADRAEVSSRMLAGQAGDLHPSGYAFLLMNYIAQDADGRLQTSRGATDTVIITETQSDSGQSESADFDYIEDLKLRDKLIEAAKKRREIWWEALVSDTVRNLLHQGVENVYIFDGETQRNFSGLNQKAAELFYDIKPRKVGFSSESKEIVIDRGYFKVRELSAEAKENMRFRDIHDSVAEAERQLQAVRERHQGTERWMKAPNGQDTNLNEHQWLQVRTENFKKWFGDWENDPANASKVVDENGEPLVVYHGTNNEVDEFNTAPETGTWSYGKGAYFSSREYYASTYGSNVMPVFIDSKNPFVEYTEYNRKMISKLKRMFRGSLDGQRYIEHGVPLESSTIAPHKITEMYKDSGYDGIMIHQGVTVVTFDPSQIKSATANYGTFSQETRDIRYRNIEPTSLPPSAVTRSVTGHKREGFTLINAVKNLAHIAETTRTAEGALFSLKDKQYHINALTGDISVLKDGEFATRGNLSSIGGLVKSYLAGDSISFVRGFGLAAELFLTDKQRQVLDSAYPNALGAANAFADYAITKDRGKLDSLAAPVFRSMALQTSNLMRKLTGRGLELSSRDIQQAAYLKRAAEMTKAEKRFISDAQRLAKGEVRFRDAVTAEQVKEISVYAEDSLRNAFPFAEVTRENWRNAAGASSYITVSYARADRRVSGKIRVSDHGVGAFRYHTDGVYYASSKGDVDGFIQRISKSMDALRSAEIVDRWVHRRSGKEVDIKDFRDVRPRADKHRSDLFVGTRISDGAEVTLVKSERAALQDSKKASDIRFRGVPVEADIAEAQRQMDSIRKQYEGTGQWLKAPNGKATNLTERQWLQVRTPNFIEWFGDWINSPETASKVVDENGEPRVVYHGTQNLKKEAFSAFNIPEKGTFFTSNKNVAQTYSGTSKRSLIYETFLNIKTPIVFDVESGYWGDISKAKLVDPDGSKTTFTFEKIYSFRDAHTDRLANLIRNNNKTDGIILDNIYDYGGKASNKLQMKASTVYVITDPNQIKSATDNVGTFSQETSDIRFRDIDDTSATALNNTAAAFLNARKLLDEVKGSELTAEQIESKVKALVAKIKDKAPALSSSAIEDMLKGKDIKTKSGATAFLNELIGKSGGAAKRSVMDGLRRIFRDTKSSEAKVGGYPSKLLRYIEHVLSLAVDHEYDADGMITGQKHTLGMELELLTKQRDEFEAQMAMADSLTEAQITKITETLSELDDKIKILMQYGGLEQKNAYDNVMAYANAYRLWKEGKELLAEHRESKRAAAKETMTQVYALLGLSNLLSTAEREAMERSMSKLQKKLKGIKDAKDAIYLSHTLMESMFEQLDKIGYTNKDDLRSALMEMDTAVQELEAQVSAMAEGDPELLKAKAELHELKTKYSAVATAYNYVKDYQGDFSGYFQERFFEPIVQATSAEYQSKQEVLRLIDETKRDIYKRVFGDSSFVSWAKFGMDYRNGVLTLDRKSGDTRVPTRYGYDEIAEIYAHSLREENQKAMENTGWDSEVLDQIHKFLESEPIGRFIKEYVDWTVGSLFPMLYDRYAPAFEKKYGFALGKEEVYFPISRKIEVVPETVDVNEPYHDFNSSSMWLKYFIDRVETNRQFSNEFLGLTRKLNDYIESMEHFKAFAPVIDDAKYTIMRSDSKLILKRMMGQRWLEVLNTYYNDIARGQRARKAKWLEKWLNKFLFGAVVWNLMSGVKQTSSTILFAGEMKNVNLARFIAGIARVLVHPAETYKIITSSPLIQKRLEHGYNMELYRALHEADVGTLRSAITQAMGKVSAVKWGDFLAVMIGGGSLYYNNYADYIKEGKTHEQAHEQALLDMDKATARTQQSSEIFGVSELQAGIGKAGALKRLIASFKSQPIAILNSMVNTIMMSGGTGKSVATTAQQATITMLLYPLVYGILASGFITPDKDDPEGWLFMWFYRMLENFGVFGDYIQYIAGAARTGRASPYGMDLMPLTASIEETGQSLAQVAAKPERMQSWDGLLVNMSQTMGVPFRSTRNLYRGVEAFISEDDERFARLLGMSKGAADLYQKKLYRRRK